MDTNDTDTNQVGAGRASARLQEERDRAIVKIALPHAVQARLLALLADREERAAAWRDSKEVIGWDTPMDSGQRMGRLHLLVTLLACYNARPSCKEEAFDEFLRLLTGGDGPPETVGGRAFRRAEGWLSRMTRAGIIAAGTLPEQSA